MQAFILAAGLGTRLHPLTDTRPKALVEVQGTPLLKIAIDNIVRQGATRIVVNIHHFADAVESYLKKHQWDADILISDERDMLLDTGGGLSKAAKLFSPDEPILIHNVDILSRLNFNAILKEHSDSMNIATLVVSQRDTSRQLLFDQQHLLEGWQNTTTGETKWVHDTPIDCIKLAFSGIAVVDPHLPQMLPKATTPFSIIPEYLNIAKKYRISYFEHSPKDWLDIGKPDTLQRAQSWTLNS